MAHRLLLVIAASVAVMVLPASDAQVGSVVGGALSGIGTLVAAKQVGDYTKGLEDALEQMRNRAIADSNLAIAQRIDQVAIDSKIMLDNINTDASAQISSLNADEQIALDRLRDTVVLLSKNIDTTTAQALLNIDQQINGFCQHSLLCKPVYAITSVTGTVINPADQPTRPLLVSGTAFVDGATIAVVVNSHTVPANEISVQNVQTRAISIPASYIPQTQYGIASYPLSITISGTIDNPDRSGWNGWKLLNPKRVTRKLASLKLSVYVLPKVPITATVTEYSPVKDWQPCRDDSDQSGCVLIQTVRTADRDVYTFQWQLATDRKLDAALDWPGNVKSPNNQTRTDFVSGDYYAFVCTTPRQVNTGDQRRYVESTCLDAVLWNENAKHCGPHVFDLIHSNDQATRDSAVAFASGCLKKGVTDRPAQFKYALSSAKNAVGKRADIKIETADLDANGAYDLGYGSYCSEQLSSANSGFSVWVSARLAFGSAPRIELTPDVPSQNIGNLAAVTVRQEPNGPRDCVRIIVSAPF